MLTLIWLIVQAATLIRNLSVNDDNKNRIAQAGGLAPLIILLSSPLPRIQEQAPLLSLSYCLFKCIWSMSLDRH